jgi:hypothetical protein
MELEPAGGRGGVDALLKNDEVDLVFLQLGGDVEQMLDRAARPVELGDDQFVTGAAVARGT